MPVFNRSSGLPLYGPGNGYGVGVRKYGVPTIVTPQPTAPVSMEDRLNSMHIDCDQWLALPADQQRYAVYLQELNVNPKFTIEDAAPIAWSITDHCQQARREQISTKYVPASGALELPGTKAQQIGAAVVLAGVAAYFSWKHYKKRR